MILPDIVPEEAGRQCERLPMQSSQTPVAPVRVSLRPALVPKPC